jgi:hypothetical protein
LALLLEIKAGPLSGEKVSVRTGETVLIGRAQGRANFAIPHDTFMSSVHFAVDCGPQGCRVTDRKSSNGTFLNGAKITEAMLANGDELRSGQTVFSVRLVADQDLTPVAPTAAPSRPPAPLPPAPKPPAPKIEPPQSIEPPRVPSPQSTAREVPPIPVVAPPPIPALRPPAPRVVAPPPVAAPLPPPPPARPVPAASRAATPLLTIGAWVFSVVPPGWEVKEEFGIQRAEGDAFPSNVIATEEMLAGEAAMPQFVESQVAMLRQYLREPKIEAILPPAIAGADEKTALDVRYNTNDGQTICSRRVYARSGKIAGTITLTTLEKDLPQVKPAFDAILAGVTFQKHEPA